MAWIVRGNGPGAARTPCSVARRPTRKYTAYLSPYLLLAHTDDGVGVSPWRVNWCDTDAPEIWTGGNAGSTLFSDEPSPIRNIAKLNEYVAVYKQASLGLLRKVDPPDIFQPLTVKTGVGLAASRAFADAEGSHYFMGQNDFFVWNGPQVDPIGKAVRDEVFSRINRSKIGRCFAVHIQELQEVWFFVVIAGFDWPREVWKYNYRLGYWFFDTCLDLTAAIKWERTNTLAWDDAVGTWDQQQTVWDAGVSVAAWEDIIFGHQDGYCSSLDYATTNDRGVAVDSHFITKDFVPGEQALMMELSGRWLQIDVWARGPGRMYVDYSDDFGDNFINIPYTSSQAYADTDGRMRKYEFYVDVWAPQARFRIRNAELSESLYVQNLTPYYLGREEIRGYRS